MSKHITMSIIVLIVLIVVKLTVEYSNLEIEYVILAFILWYRLDYLFEDKNND